MKSRVTQPASIKNLSKPLILFICGCTSAPLPPFNYSGIKAGKWHAKVNLKDTLKNKDYTLDIDFKSIKPGTKTRIDVNSFLGIHVASIVIDGEKYQALLIKKKEFRSGIGNGKALDPEVLGVGIDLRILPALLFDEAISDQGWACNFDGANKVIACESTAQGIRMEWSKRDGIKKEVIVMAKGYNMKVDVDKFTPVEEFPEKTFLLPLPKGFKKVN